MKRCLLLLAVLAAASALQAQDGQKYSREDVLAVFAQYNPQVLENAKVNEDYNHILQQWASAYQQEKSPQADWELMAVAKNFDNSLRLFVIAQTYEESLALQKAANMELASLDVSTRQALVAVFQDIYNATLDIKAQEIAQTKARIKTLKKDKTLAAAQRKLQLAQEKALLKSLKTEVKTLKKDASAKVKSASDVYFADMKERALAKLETAYQAALKQAQQAKSSSNRQVKSKNKKPVGK